MSGVSPRILTPPWPFQFCTCDLPIRCIPGGGGNITEVTLSKPMHCKLTLNSKPYLHFRQFHKFCKIKSKSFFWNSGQSNCPPTAICYYKGVCMLQVYLPQLFGNSIAGHTLSVPTLLWKELEESLTSFAKTNCDPQLKLKDITDDPSEQWTDAWQEAALI